MQALLAYKNKNGAYPSSLNEVIPDIPSSSREVAERFSYCKKNSPSDETAKCSDGSIFIGASEISIGTGQYGSVSFSLHNSDSPIDYDMPIECRAE